MGISHAGTHFGHFLKRTEIEFPSGSGQNGAYYYSSCGKLHPTQDLGVTDPIRTDARGRCFHTRCFPGQFATAASIA